jgi:hypothetical protein
MCQWPAPSARLRSMKGRSFTESACARTTRAVLAHEVIAITTITLTSVGPITAVSAIASAIHGSTRNQFVTAFSIVSTRVPPKYPAVMPTLEPISIVPKAAVNPTRSEMRAPCTMSSSTDRPKLSVPSG